MANEALADSIYVGVVLEQDGAFFKVKGNDDFAEGFGFRTHDYHNPPSVYNIKATYGNKLEESDFTKPASQFNTINISNFISSFDLPRLVCNCGFFCTFMACLEVVDRLDETDQI